MVRAGEQSPRRLAEAEVKRGEALELFLAGKTYQQIAETVGYADRSGAWQAVRTALTEAAERNKELAGHALTAVLAKLDRLWAAQDKAAQDGDTKAAALQLQMIDRYIKLHRLDHIQIEATVTTRSELDAEIEGLVARLAAAAAAANPQPAQEK